MSILRIKKSYINKYERLDEIYFPVENTHSMNQYDYLIIYLET